MRLPGRHPHRLHHFGLPPSIRSLAHPGHPYRISASQRSIVLEDQILYRSRVFPVTLIHQKARAQGLEYLVIGGHAINVYCEPRATLDVDFLVRKEDRTKWCELLSTEGFGLRHDGQTFLQFSPPYGVEWRLDLMLVSNQTFVKMADAARPVELLGIQTQIPEPKHLIALKLHALKHGHAERLEKDLGDVLALPRNAGLDPGAESYRQLVERFGSVELYELILKRFGKR